MTKCGKGLMLMLIMCSFVEKRLIPFATLLFFCTFAP